MNTQVLKFTSLAFVLTVLPLLVALFFSFLSLTERLNCLYNAFCTKNSQPCVQRPLSSPALPLHQQVPRSSPCMEQLLSRLNQVQPSE